MLKLTDSGCREHQVRQIALAGAAAALVGQLIVNLPLTDGGHTYICEHGHTHCLMLQPRGKKVSSSPPKLGYARDKASTH
jgi:hypothetical protein